MLPYVLALIRSSVTSIRRDEGGQGLVEYALILAFVALAVVGVLAFIAPPVAAVFQSVFDSI